MRPGRLSPARAKAKLASQEYSPSEERNLRRSGNIVNPHRRGRCAQKHRKLEEVEESPPKPALIGPGNQPARADAGNSERESTRIAGPK